MFVNVTLATFPEGELHALFFFSILNYFLFHCINFLSRRTVYKRGMALCQIPYFSTVRTSRIHCNRFSYGV